MTGSVRATGKTGGNWTDKETTNIFLDHCKPHRVLLRKAKVPKNVWEQISDSLWEIGVDYSFEQLREKMRNLRRYFAEAKNGLHNGRAWLYYSKMHYLHDAPMESNSDSLNITLGNCSSFASLVEEMCFI